MSSAQLIKIMTQKIPLYVSRLQFQQYIYLLFAQLHSRMYVLNALHTLCHNNKIKEVKETCLQVCKK